MNNIKENIFLIFLNLFYVHSIIILPLKSLTNNQTSKLFQKYLPNELYTTIQIGTPPQQLEANIQFNNLPLAIVNLECKAKSNYNKDLSLTFKNISKFSSNYIIKNGYNAEETIYLNDDFLLTNKIKIEKFPFVLEDKDNENNGELNNNCGILSLKLLGLYINNDFITNLKKLGYINEYSWTVKFKNYNEGYLIIGEYPHKYEKNNYIESDLRVTGVNTRDYYWNIEFKNVFSDSIPLKESLYADISLDVDFICGTEEYEKEIRKQFFNKYLANNQCFKDSIQTYNYYYCDKKKFGKSDIKKFPSLKFYNIQLNYSFVLEGNDLFIEKNEKYYFLISFIKDMFHWKLGKLFLQKYQLIFNYDTKTIGLYINTEKNDDNNNKLLLYLKIISVGFCIVLIFLILGVITGKKIFFKKRKQKSNEIKDDYDYKAKIDDISENVIEKNY